MGKIDAKMEGRTEGLELALRIVREGGVEALERERNETSESYRDQGSCRS